MSDKMKLYIISSLKNEMEAILGDNYTEESISAFANDAVSVIDWDNSALMHKDMAWIAAYYLRKKKIA